MTSSQVGLELWRQTAMGPEHRNVISVLKVLVIQIPICRGNDPASWMPLLPQRRKQQPLMAFLAVGGANSGARPKLRSPVPDVRHEARL